jgi:hypothetical protein
MNHTSRTWIAAVIAPKYATTRARFSRSWSVPALLQVARIIRSPVVSQGGSGTRKTAPLDALVFFITMGAISHSGARDGLASQIDLLPATLPHGTSARRLTVVRCSAGSGLRRRRKSDV